MWDYCEFEILLESAWKRRMVLERVKSREKELTRNKKDESPFEFVLLAG